MTLKEKFLPFVWFNNNSFNVHQNIEKDNNSNECVKIADEYAIGFAEWCDNNKVSAPWKELLEIYKNEIHI